MDLSVSLKSEVSDSGWKQFDAPVIYVETAEDSLVNKKLIVKWDTWATNVNKMKFEYSVNSDFSLPVFEDEFMGVTAPRRLFEKY